METKSFWENFAVHGRDIETDQVRPIVLESWKRCRNYGIDPFNVGTVSVSDVEFDNRKKKKAELLKAAIPYLHKLYKIIKNTGSIITIADEDGVILDCFAEEDLLKMKNFPKTGTLHNEKTIGTSGVGTCLFLGKAIQLIGFEHWLQDNHGWICNTTPILWHNNIIGCVNLSCPVEKGHSHSLGLVVATANAIEREMGMNSALEEKKRLVSLQAAIIELLDTGIIVVNEKGIITQNNNKTLQILDINEDCTEKKVSEILNCSYDFDNAFRHRIELDNFEIPVKIGRKHSYIGFSTAFIENNGKTEGMILRIREPASIRRFANIAGGATAIYTFDDIIGSSEFLMETIKIAKLATANNTNVLITGESGTGKEVVAQSIHNGSNRKNKAFVAINCGALSRELIQSELFGYEGGSFTGAKKNGNPGKFELADGGTLFLDEIGEMPLEAQTNLLRVLQTGNVLRIGARHPNSVDVRVIAATNKNLEEEIRKKNFRHDLYYRLNVLQIKIPALRERKDDVEVLSDHFLSRFSCEMKRSINGIDAEGMNLLQEYSWPGNIRELENTIERAVLISETNMIQPADLPDSIRYFHAQELKSDPASSIIVDSNKNIDQVELGYIQNLLQKYGGNLRASSAAMGVARSTLYNKLKKYNIDPEQYR